MSAQTAADLRAAAAILRRDGWTQGRYHSADGCHCALGAVITAITGANVNILADDEMHRYDAAWDLLTDLLGDQPPAWNDAEGRTADEVIAALEAAATTAEQA